MRRVVTPKPVTAIQTNIHDSVHYTPGIVCYIHRIHHAQSQSVLNSRDTRQSLAASEFARSGLAPHHTAWIRKVYVLKHVIGTVVYVQAHVGDIVIYVSVHVSDTMAYVQAHVYRLVVNYAHAHAGLCCRAEARARLYAGTWL